MIKLNLHPTVLVSELAEVHLPKLAFHQGEKIGASFSKEIEVRQLTRWGKFVQIINRDNSVVKNVALGVVALALAVSVVGLVVLAAWSLETSKQAKEELIKIVEIQKLNRRVAEINQRALLIHELGLMNQFKDIPELTLHLDSPLVKNLSSADLSHPIMKGLDQKNRPFIAIKFVDSQGNPFVTTFFQKHVSEKRHLEGWSVVQDSNQPVETLQSALPQMRKIICGEHQNFKLVEQKPAKSSSHFLSFLSKLGSFFTQENNNNQKLKTPQDPLERLLAKNEPFVAFYQSGPTEFLGNFAVCPNGLSLEGKTFRCSEAAFQWKKYQLAARERGRNDLLQDPKLNEFFTCDGEQAFQLRKYFDRRYPGVFPANWKRGQRDQVMWEVLQAKFRDNPSFRSELNKTKGRYLLEHNPVVGRDDYWSDNSDGTGKNMLGQQLMALREGLPCPLPNQNSQSLLTQQYARMANTFS